MISPFIDDSKEIEVKVFLATHSKYVIVADIDKQALLSVYENEIEEKDVQEENIKFRLPTYGDSNRIFDAGVKMEGFSDETSSVKVSPAQVRFERMVLLAKSWSFKDASGNQTNPNRETIKKLHPIVAAAIGNGLELELKERGLL